MILQNFIIKFGGEGWDKPLSRLNGEIILPEGVSNDSVIVYFHPEKSIKNYSFKGEKISFSTNKLYGYLEVRILMPKDAFLYSNNSHLYYENFLFNSELEKENIIKIEEEYSKWYNRRYIFLSCLVYFYLAFLIFTPILIYIKYGKEPKISYKGIFEREPVKGIKPYIANALCNSNPGYINENAITATLLDLVRRKHIKLYEIPNKNRAKDLVFEFLDNPHDMLTEPEKIVYDFFKSFSTSGKLVWNDFLNSLKKEENALRFIRFKEKFSKSIREHHDLKKYFNSTGYILIWVFLILVAILTSYLIYILGDSVKAGIPIGIVYFRLFTLVPILYIYFIILVSLPQRIFGKFTKEGYEIYLKLINFRKFITNMTLLKRYPPASIIIWEEYLVYACAFGVADKVIKEMKIIVPEYTMQSSSLYFAYNVSTLKTIDSSYFTAIRHAGVSGSSSGGFSGGGGVGGGFGGGGGGAR